MSLFGEVPFGVLVGPEADEEHPPALLRHAVVGGVHQLRHDGVLEVRSHRGVLTLQAREVVAPGLAVAGDDLGVPQAQLDVLVVVGERRAQQAAHVLDDKRAGLELADHLGGGREHVALVVGRVALAASGEGLAGRTSADQVHAVGYGRPVDGAHVALADINPTHQRIPVVTVAAHGVARPVVPLRDDLGGESGEVRAKGKTTPTGEQLDTTHG